MVLPIIPPLSALITGGIAMTSAIGIGSSLLAKRDNLLGERSSLENKVSGMTKDLLSSRKDRLNNLSQLPIPGRSRRSSPRKNFTSSFTELINDKFPVGLI